MTDGRQNFVISTITLQPSCGGRGLAAHDNLVIVANDVGPQPVCKRLEQSRVCDADLGRQIFGWIPKALRIKGSILGREISSGWGHGRSMWGRLVFRSCQTVRSLGRNNEHTAIAFVIPLDVPL